MHPISQAAIISVLGSSSIPNSQNPLCSRELPFHVHVFGRTSIQCIPVTPPSDLHHPFLIVQSRLNGFRFICSLSFGPKMSDKILCSRSLPDLFISQSARKSFTSQAVLPMEPSTSTFYTLSLYRSHEIQVQIVVRGDGRRQ
jgi:hypothetical protein